MSNAMQEQNIFLKLGDVKGSAQEKGFESQVAVLSYSFGVYGSGSKFSSGNAHATPLSLVIEGGGVAGTMRNLLQNRKLIEESILTETQVDGKGGNKSVLTFKLAKVKVTSVQSGGAQGYAAQPTSVTLECMGIKEEHAFTDETGKKLPKTIVDWDIAKGTST